MMRGLMRCSKHFIMTGVKATGQWSFKQDITGFFTTGMLVEVLKQAGTIF